MAEIAFVCLYTGYLEVLEPYSDAERGRLMTAMLRYGIYGEVPDFTGNERFIWPMLQDRINRDIENYRKKCARSMWKA